MFVEWTPSGQHAFPRMVGPDVIPLPHIYGARIKGVEVFCPLDPPPPYEAVVSQEDQEQVWIWGSSLFTFGREGMRCSA